MLGESFDPTADWLVDQHYRPHWSQPGAVVFITFRTQDSIPSAVAEQWERDKREWLRQRGLDMGEHWSVVLRGLAEKDRVDFQRTFNRCREIDLDSCQGRCVLKRPELSKIVADSLLHFDGDRYRMGDFVVMPNHVHLLAVFTTPNEMKDQCDSWLHYTAFQINQAIGERGRFWQREPFDHIVRSARQYEYLRQYIADNPLKARLSPGEYLYRRYEDNR